VNTWKKFEGGERMEYNGGKIEISDNVIKEIIFRAAVEYMKIEDNQREQKKLRKNIVIQRTPEDHLEITIKDVTAPYNTSLKKYAEELMEKIKETVERMTEMQVDSVNIQIGDISELGEESQESMENEEKEE
jgi:uncharacterized alkaline shock family protein YloU